MREEAIERLAVSKDGDMPHWPICRKASGGLAGGGGYCMSARYRQIVNVGSKVYTRLSAAPELRRELGLN
jgi:hypothetical protein